MIKGNVKVCWAFYYSDVCPHEANSVLQSDSNKQARMWKSSSLCETFECINHMTIPAQQNRDVSKYSLFENEYLTFYTASHYLHAVNKENVKAQESFLYSTETHSA